MPRHSRTTVRKFFRLLRERGLNAARQETGIRNTTSLLWLKKGERGTLKGVANVNRPNWNRARDAEIRELLAQGVRQVEIARRYRLSRQRVSTIVRRLRKGVV